VGKLKEKRDVEMEIDGEGMIKLEREMCGNGKRERCD
jgi:hypothetical protein